MVWAGLVSWALSKMASGSWNGFQRENTHVRVFLTALSIYVFGRVFLAIKTITCILRWYVFWCLRVCLLGWLGMWIGGKWYAFWSVKVCGNAPETMFFGPNLHTLPLLCGQGWDPLQAQIVDLLANFDSEFVLSWVLSRFSRMRRCVFSNLPLGARASFDAHMSRRRLFIAFKVVSCLSMT